MAQPLRQSPFRISRDGPDNRFYSATPPKFYKPEMIVLGARYRMDNGATVFVMFNTRGEMAHFFDRQVPSQGKKSKNGRPDAARYSGRKKQFGSQMRPKAYGHTRRSGRSLY